MFDEVVFLWERGWVGRGERERGGGERE